MHQDEKGNQVFQEAKKSWYNSSSAAAHFMSSA